jgi:hypothetical protein
MAHNYYNPALEAELAYRREQLLAARRSHSGTVPWIRRRRRRSGS